MAGLSASYLSVDSFAVAGDYTEHLLEDRAVLCDCGVDGEKKRIIASSSFGAGATTVTLVTDATRNLTSNLDTIQWSLSKPGSEGTIQHHGHSNDDDGGLVSGAPAAHKDRHDPEDGADPLDCAAPGEIIGVAAAAEGSAHSFARSDHTHQIQHSIANNHVVTIDSPDVQDNDFARFTPNGLEGLNYAEVMTILSGEAISAFSFNGQNITNVGTVDGVDVSAHASRHENGGADEINVAGLSGELADAQPPKAHAGDHIGATDEVDGDKLDIDWNPSNYTPAATPAEADDVDDLTAHLYGIDQELGSVGETGFSPNSVATKTDNYAVTTSDFNKSLRMDSADDKTFTLPSVGATEDGKRVTLVKAGAGEVMIVASDDDVIVLGDAEGMSIRSTQTYPEQATITLEYCHSETAWLIIGMSGVWATQNYFGDGSDGALSTGGDVNLSAVEDGDMILKQYTTLTVNAGHTLTTDNRCKGLFIYVQSDCTIEGTLSMSGRGANVDPAAAGVSATGIRLPMLKSGETDSLEAADFSGCGAAVIAAVARQPGIIGNGKIFIIAREGAAGGAAKTSQGAGNAGSAGGANQSGGGGGGGADYEGDGGAGAAGTCFSGGSGGGGGAGIDAGGIPVGGDGGANGGAGGDGAVNGSTESDAAGGGAGNPGGSKAERNGGVAEDGGSGTGGLLVLVVGGDLTISAAGIISADGVGGGGASVGSYKAGGGGSGGGNVLILHAGALSNSGTIQATGGAKGEAGTYDGGTGGAGSVQGPIQVDA